MSNFSEGTLLHFPLQGPVPSAEVLIVRDLEVAGVGSVRRQQLEDLSRNKKLILWTYENLIPEDVKFIYQEELLRTLQALRPFKVEAGPEIDLQSEHRRLFASLFPRLRSYMGLTAEKVRDEYLADMSWSSWLLQDHWRYFAGFIRQKFPQNKALQEIGQWEWIQAWLETQAFQSTGLGDPGTIVTNPSLQYLSLEQAFDFLGREEGVYAFVYSERRHKIIERKLDIYEAEILDSLAEDRKFHADQLAETLSQTSETPVPISKIQWNEKIQGLIAEDVIIAVSP